MTDGELLPATTDGNGAVRNGRDANGYFAKGNPGGPGNIYAKRAQQIRKVLYDAVSDQDIRDVLATLLMEARSGNVQAIREFFDRMVGKPDQAHTVVGVIGTNALTPEQVAEVILAGRVEQPAE